MTKFGSASSGVVRRILRILVLADRKLEGRASLVSEVVRPISPTLILVDRKLEGRASSTRLVRRKTPSKCIWAESTIRWTGLQSGGIWRRTH